MDRPLASIEGKYEILEKISEGGMGAVYKVHHRLLERIRVIKVMRPQLAADTRMKKRFIREAKLAGGLRHPNIAEVYDFAMEEDDNAYLVMEYVRGITLLELLDLGLPTLGLSVELADQSLAALGYLHNKGIIHRDMSPDNVMVTVGEDGRPLVKLIDLGIAKLVESEGELTAAGSFIGKVKYASPEHFRRGHGAEVDRRADLYSFGVVLYELFTGRHPIAAKDVSGYLAGHVLHPPQSFHDSDPEGRVPAELRAVVIKALAKQPNERYPDAEAFRVALRAAAQDLSFAPDELEKVLAGRTDTEQPLNAEERDSTQARFDGNFGPGTTPPITASPGPDSGQTRRRSPPDSFQAEMDDMAPTQDIGTKATRKGLEKVRASSQGRSVRGKARLLVELGAAAAVLVVAATVWLLIGSPAPPGVLIVDARPWAQVTEVTDEAGNQFLASPAYTPLRLTVDPGSYRISLRNEETEQQLTAEVTASETVTRVAEFSETDIDDFFRGLGF